MTTGRINQVAVLTRPTGAANGKQTGSDSRNHPHRPSPGPRAHPTAAQRDKRTCPGTHLVAFTHKNPPDGATTAVTTHEARIRRQYRPRDPFCGPFEHAQVQHHTQTREGRTAPNKRLRTTQTQPGAVARPHPEQKHSRSLHVASAGRNQTLPRKMLFSYCSA